MIGQFLNHTLWRYPRMSPYDTPLWEQFILEHGKDYDSFDYDLKVGSGVTPSAEMEDKYKRDFQELSKKRIDAVGYKDDFATIFEVKPRAGLSALGQLIAYHDLFIYSFPSIPVRSLAIITSFMTKEERILYEKRNILIYIYSA